jgi:hypothetical protein
MPFTINGVWMWSLVGVTKAAFAKDPQFFQYHLHSFKEYHTVDGQEEHVLRELCSLPAFLEDKAKLRLMRAKGPCILPWIITAIMLYSDATLLVQFGNAKAWPIYVFYGNLSKYLCGQPTARAAHHVAYMPRVSVLLEHRGFPFLTSGCSYWTLSTNGFRRTRRQARC